LVKNLVDNVEYAAHQVNQVNWPGTNNSGNVVGSGIYIVVIRAGNFKAYVKAAVIK
jgi:flagellar hook assembly protein FlgD